MLEALGPITPGVLTGLELIVEGLEAAEDLRGVGNMSAAFSGGKEAKRYVEGLHERLHAPQMYLDATAVDAKTRAERKRRDIAMFAARLGAAEELAPVSDAAPPADAPLADEAPPCPPE